MSCRSCVSTLVPVVGIFTVMFMLISAWTWLLYRSWLHSGLVVFELVAFRRLRIPFMEIVLRLAFVLFSEKRERVIKRRFEKTYAYTFVHNFNVTRFVGRYILGSTHSIIPTSHPRHQPSHALNIFVIWVCPLLERLWMSSASVLSPATGTMRYNLCFRPCNKFIRSNNPG